MATLLTDLLLIGALAMADNALLALAGDDPHTTFRDLALANANARFADNPWAMPTRAPAELRAYNPERPRDAMAPVSETISPTMAAHGLASLVTTAALDAGQGK